MIPQQRDELTASSFGLHLPLLDRIENFSVVVPAIDFVPGLDDVEGTAYPLVLHVDGARETQSAACMIEVSVKVSHGNEPRGCGSREP
jgi:hypothetical protein